MKNVLIDTDVVLDLFLDIEPFSEHAATILSMCEKNEIAGFVTPVIISNVYYILSQENKQEKVLDKLKNLLLIIDVLIIDKTTILVALNSNFKDFEDALQNYAAELNGTIDLIITRNTKDYKKSQIGVMNPVAFLKTI